MDVCVDIAHQRFAALVREGGNFVHRAFPLQALHKIGYPGGALFGRHHIQFIEYQPAGFVVQGFVVFLQFGHDGFGLGHGIDAVVERGHVHDVQQQAGALQMAQELVPQPGALAGALNQAGNVGHHKALLWPDAHHAQIGVERGEGVIGNFGACVADGGNEGGFARIGHAQQAHIGQHLEFEPQAFFLARIAECFLAGCAVDGAFESQVAKTAVAAFGDQDFFARHQQLEQNLAGFGVADDGAHRHFEGDVVTGRAKHIAAHAVLPALGLEAARVAKIHQGVEVDVGNRPDMAATTAVAAVRAAKFLVFFVPKRCAAVAAIAGGHVDQGFINKFHG